MKKKTQSYHREKQMSDISGLVKSRKFLELMRFPEEQREKVKAILDGKEVVIEHTVRHGKIICRFIPTPADEIIKEDMRRQFHGEPITVYQGGSATREVHEKEVRKEMKKGVSPERLIDGFLKREQTEGITFFEPVADLKKTYLYSQELLRQLPEFLNYLVEKIDINQVCVELDQYQTLDFISPALAESAAETKKLLAEDFLAKHKNEPELKQILRIEPGGARKKKGFVLTKDKKVTFFSKVESLPKHKGKSVWQFILEELIEQEFDSETVSWLKTYPALKGIPKELFNEAVKTWRKYLEQENWGEMRPQDKPRAFEFRHALHLLDYPDEFTFSTLETYYYQGKKLSDNQKQL